MNPTKIQQLATPQFATNSVYGSPQVAVAPAPNPTLTPAAAVTNQAPTASGGETYAQVLARQSNVGKTGYDVFGNPVSGNTTAGAITGGLTQSDIGGISAADKAFLSSAPMQYNSPTTTAEQEAQIRQQTMQRFQSEIDNTNRYYDQLLAQAKVDGANLLGQASAVQARRGMLGSNVGAAIDASGDAANRRVEASVQSQRDSAIASIMNNGATAVNNDIKLAREAASRGYAAWLDHASGQATRETARATTAAKVLLEKGLDPTSDSALLKQIADAYQIDPSTVLSAYHDENLAKKTQDLKDAYQKAQTDALAVKDRYQTVTDGTQLFDLVTGKMVANNQKDFAPAKSKAAAGTGTYSSGGVYKSDLDALIGRVRTTIAAKNQRDAFDGAISKARNEDDKLRTIASNVPLPAQVKVDINKTIQAIPFIDSAIAEVKHGADTGVLQASKQYAYDIAGHNYDPALTKMNQYITVAKQQYRNAITGAAWGAQEDAEYNALFGSTKYDPASLQARLEGIKDIFRRQVLTSISAAADPLGMGGGAIGNYQAPASAPATTDKYTTGTVYKNAKGQKAKYLGNDQWEIVQ